MTLSRENYSPSHIDAMLSLRFDECSIAAADTSALAEKLAFGPERSHARQEQSLYMADKLGATIEPRMFTTLSIATVEPQFDLANNKTVDIVIADSPDSQSPTPFMAAVLSSGVAIEIARFEKRLNGECSYVQLGQEINDDSLVITSTDPRSQQVESIRALFNAYNTGDSSSFDSESSNTFNRFVTSELESNRARIEELLAPALSMLARSKANDSLSQLRTSLYRTHFDDHQSIQAMPLARPLVSDALDGNKLVSFNPVSYTRPDNDNAFRAVSFNLITDAPEAKKAGFFGRFNKTETQKATRSEIVTLSGIVRDDLAIDLVEFHRNNVFILDRSSESNRTPATSEQLLAIATLLDAEPSSYSERLSSLLAGVTPTRLALSKASSYTKPFWKERQALGAIIEASGLPERLDAVIGEHLPSLERIITALGTHALRESVINRQLMLENRKIGKTYSDVIAEVAITTAENGVYGVSVHARPAVNDPRDAVEIFNVRLNKYSKTHHKPEIIKELEELIHLSLSK